MRKIVFVAVVASALSGSPAFAQSVGSTAAPDQAAAGNDLEQIIVTGTRRTDRTSTTSPVPVDVFSSDVLEKEASGNMNDILRDLVPSFEVGQPTKDDGSTFVRPPTLRGLPPDDVLVLIDGKRRYRSALVQLSGPDFANGSEGVDLSQIPTIALDRVEVLRDGASAQYGSDAIAGVINFALKKNNSGETLVARYGEFTRGDGQNVQIAGNAGFGLGTRGFLSVSAEYDASNVTSVNGQNAAAYAVNLQMPNLGIPDPVERIGDPQRRAYHVFANSGYDIGQNAQLYMFGDFGQSKFKQSFSWRDPVTVTGPASSGFGTQTYSRTASVYDPIYLATTGGIDPVTGKPIYNASGPTYSFNSLYPAGFVPHFLGDLQDFSLTGGFKGNLNSGFRYDFSGSDGQSQIAYHINNSLNPSLGPSTPTSFYLGELKQNELNLNADFSYELQAGLASPITMAFGAERRRETYTVSPGDEASYIAGPYGVQPLNTFTTSDGVTTRDYQTHGVGSAGFNGLDAAVAGAFPRTNYAGYVDFEADVTHDFSAGLAGRYEHFSDFGDTTNGKATARYALSPAIAIRGSASTGFRAPTPGQENTASVTTVFNNGIQQDQATVPPSSITGRYFGAEPLKPEKSDNLSAGMVFTPYSRTSITLDYYNIFVRDRLGLSSVKEATDTDRAALLALGVQNAYSIGEIQFFTNAFNTRTQGVDLVASNYSAISDLGTFTSVLSVNYNSTSVTKRDPTVIDDVTKEDIERLNPRIRGNFTETWSIRQFEITGRASFFGPFVSDAYPDDGGRLDFGSEWVFDLDVAKHITRNVKLSVGAQNLFDSYPDPDRRAVGQPNSNWYVVTGGRRDGSKYLDTSPAGFNGAFWYVRITSTF